MRFHKRHDLRRVGSASWAKNALANLKISLVRFSSAFSLRSRFSSSASLLVNRSSRSPRSASSWRTHLRNVSVPIPSSRATSAIVRPSEDRYKSIARALNSGANLLGLVTISSSFGPIRPRSRASRKAGEPQFPYAAATSGRIDLDHTIPYQNPEDGGPPGQTRIGNLGPHTRLHHRLKTHGHWQVRQPEPGTWLWRSPHHRIYLTNNTGTHNIGNTEFAHAIWHAAANPVPDVRPLSPVGR